MSTRLKAIWADLLRAAPTWLGGQGQGISALTQGPGLAQLNQDLANGLRPTAQSIESWLQTTETGRYLLRNGWIEGPAHRDARLARAGPVANPYVEEFHPSLSQPQTPAVAYGKGTVQSITTGPINVTVNVTNPTPANPQAIGEAAGNAVQSQIRQLLADPPSP